MKMNRSIVIFSLITLNMKIVNSSSFCTDPEDYECKHLGISKCVPKLKRSTTQKPLPIEKPPCAVPCLDTDSWCEERGTCIDKDEHCDCGPDKIYCTSEDAYSCESRKGILQSNIFNICRNGECRKNCSMAEEEEMEGCGEGQFKCGETCLDNVDVVQNRTCNQHCISVHKTCYAKQEEVSAVINDSEKDFFSSSFCADPDDYECKHLGISKCVPKLNRSTTQKPLPIEKPPCAVPCGDTDSWCEERGACIDKDEHCDCGPDKIYCTSQDAYNCMSRKVILQSHTFNICRNGECRKNCTMAEEEGTEGCEEGQFRCGGRCLDNVDVVQFRTCNKQCISVHKTCFAKQEEVSLVINDSEICFSSDRIVICLCVIILVLFGVNCFLCYILYYRVESNSKWIQIIKTSPKTVLRTKSLRKKHAADEQRL